MVRAVALESRARVSAVAVLLFLVSLPLSAEAQLATFGRPGAALTIGISNNLVYESASNPSAPQFQVVPAYTAPGYFMIQSALGFCITLRSDNRFEMSPCNEANETLFKFYRDPWSQNMPPEWRLYPYFVRPLLLPQSELMIDASGFLSTAPFDSTIPRNDRWFVFGNGMSGWHPLL